MKQTGPSTLTSREVCQKLSIKQGSLHTKCLRVGVKPKQVVRRGRTVNLFTPAQLKLLKEDGT